MSDAPPNTGSLIGGFGGLFTVAGLIYTAVNHKRVRLNCCGRKLEIEMDVESTAKVAPEPEKKEESV